MTRHLPVLTLGVTSVLLLLLQLVELPSPPSVHPSGLAYAGPVALVALELRP
jgi:hypothetical protein